MSIGSVKYHLAGSRQRFVRRRFALFCLLAFFARFSVTLGHDCGEVNIIQKISRVRAAAPCRNHLARASADGTGVPKSGAKTPPCHQHKTCEICKNYEQLFKEFSVFPFVAVIDVPQSFFTGLFPALRCPSYRGEMLTLLPRAPPLTAVFPA